MECIKYKRKLCSGKLETRTKELNKELLRDKDFRR